VRILLAGATGVIGRPLVPRLVEDGHTVVGITRSPESAGPLREMGAEPVVCDVFDAERLREAAVSVRAEVVIQHLTDLPQDLNPRNLVRAYEANDRLRSEGSRNLLAAAAEAGARRYIAQNVCFIYAREGEPVKDEDAPLYTDAPAPFDRTMRISEEMERRIVQAEALDGLVLRFGFWYGPGTTYASDGYIAEQVRKRRFPLVGDGSGIFSFVHVDDAVEATIAALDRGAAGAYNVCDDDPAPMREWLPAYAEALGATPPRRVPRWLARLVVGRFTSSMATELRGASNAKAKRELGWEPRYPSWRDGFRRALG
jgi:nucleoside-diphosphate-sugar epimerase